MRPGIGGGLPESVVRTDTRRRLLSWIPISIVALLCIAFVVGAVWMQNSWWTDPDRPADESQQADDGMSLFTGPGMDYLTRQGVVRVRIGPDSLPATELGLEADGSQTFEPITPIRAVAVAPDGSFHVDLVRSFTLTTADNRVESVEFEREANGAWLTVFPDLQRVASAWGWAEADLTQLQDDLAAAARDGNGERYSAWLPLVEHKGAAVSAEVDVDVATPEVTATFLIGQLDQ